AMYQSNTTPKMSVRPAARNGITGRMPLGSNGSNMSTTTWLPLASAGAKPRNVAYSSAKRTISNAQTVGVLKNERAITSNRTIATISGTSSGAAVRNNRLTAATPRSQARNQAGAIARPPPDACLGYQ